jgi:hypothetical protein
MQATRRRVTAAAVRKSPLSGSLPKVSSFISDFNGQLPDEAEDPDGKKAGFKRRLPTVSSLFSLKLKTKRSLYWAGCSTAVILLVMQNSKYFHDLIFGNDRFVHDGGRSGVDNMHLPVDALPESREDSVPVPIPPRSVPQKVEHRENTDTASGPEPSPHGLHKSIESNSTTATDQLHRPHPPLKEHGMIPAHVPAPPVPVDKDDSHRMPVHRMNKPRLAPDSPTSPAASSEKDNHEQEFLNWCRLALGIETSLQIQTFQYYDYMQALPDQDWEQDDVLGDDDDEQRNRSMTPLPMILVRGLAASRDISVGDVVIRIPLQALFSVTTTIDKDPVLGPLIGAEARRRRGWNLDGSATDDATATTASSTDDGATSQSLIEIPLLAVALLHHKRLGSTSSLAPYIRMLNDTPVDSMPYLWNKTKLRTISEGIRTVARGVKRDMKAMYERVVKVLIAEHPHVFNEDAFSYENFQWAFAIVNSRHWQLPVLDMQPPTAAAVASARRTQARQRVEDTVDQQIPPADTPTDAWIDGTNDQQDQTEQKALADTVTASKTPDAPIPKHSFLAPFADLLNFGPPCTTGKYNRDTHTFEIIATCAFRPGQEVTFWYSDECDHIIVGLYGFMHPMIPPCPSAEDYRRTSDEWRGRAEELELQLLESNEDLYRLDRETSYLHKLLKDCDCQTYNEEIKKLAIGTERDVQHNEERVGAGAEEAPLSRLRHEHVRGGLADREDIERRGVRKATRERDSEF